MGFYAIFNRPIDDNVHGNSVANNKNLHPLQLKFRRRMMERKRQSELGNGQEEIMRQEYKDKSRERRRRLRRMMVALIGGFFAPMSILFAVPALTEDWYARRTRGRLRSDLFSQVDPICGAKHLGNSQRSTASSRLWSLFTCLFNRRIVFLHFPTGTSPTSTLLDDLFCFIRLQHTLGHLGSQYLCCSTFESQVLPA
jgi:hypothetical protein